MNIPDYKNRGLKATDIFTASGLYFGGRGLLTIFLTLISPPIKGGNYSLSILIGLGFFAFGIVLFKLGVHFAPRSLYRTGSNHDWDNCVKRILENAKKGDSVAEPRAISQPKSSPSHDIDIQYHW